MTVPGPSRGAGLAGARAYRLGTQSWTYFPDWQGSFYPPELRPSDALGFYARVFDTVEVNATFHAIPTASTVEGWARRTPDAFRFALKLPRAITHEARLDLATCEPLLQQFLDIASRLGHKLGPLLVQLPPSFDRTPENRRALAQFLDRLPRKSLRVAVELRHDSWADEAVEQALAERNVAWCLAEFGANARVAIYPADFTYARWTRAMDQEALPSYAEVWLDRADALDWWAATLQAIPQRVRTVYGYMSNEFAGHAPASLRMLQARLGLPTTDPTSRWPQRPLF